MQSSQNSNEPVSSTSSGGFRHFLTSTGGYVVMCIVFAVIIWGLMCLLIHNESPIAYGIAVLCIFFGWRALNRITPSIFLFMPIGGWLLYFFVKLVLSAFIGLFVAPFQIGKMIAGAINRSV